MLTIAICEDEQTAARQLKQLTAQYCQHRQLEYTIHLLCSAEALLTVYPEPDILLMDIQLPGEDGMTAAKRLRQAGFGGALLFITAYPRYVFGAFELEAVHYLLKPAKAETLFPALDRAVRQACARKQDTILLRQQGQSMRVAILDIFCCEALDRQVLVHTRAGRLTYPGTLDSLESQLGPPFFRCHRSYLVNMDAVIGQQGEQVLFPGNVRALISRRKRREFSQKLLKSCQRS